MISVEEKPHAAYQHCQTDTTHNAAVCGGVFVRERESEQYPNSVVSVSQDEVTDSLNIQSVSVIQPCVRTIWSGVSLHHLLHLHFNILGVRTAESFL